MWVEQRVVEPAPHVNIIPFEDCSRLGKTLDEQSSFSIDGLKQDLCERKIEKCQLTGAGDGNRTRMTSLEGWSSTIELRPQQPPG